MDDYQRYDKADHAPFESLKGLKIAQIEGLEVGSERITFLTEDGQKFTLTYYYDCCASCSVEEIHGDVSDLLSSEILMAEHVESKEPDANESARRQKLKDDFIPKYDGDEYYDSYESETWAFYKLATIKGSVTIRWYGSSNGYYSESATFEKWKSP